MKSITKKRQFIKGMDVSTFLELEELGAVYYDKDGEEWNLLSILQGYGMNAVRLRLWNNPYSKEGEPYGAGTNDIDKTVEMARRVRDRNMEWMLNLHYSDFWADADRQVKPKAWYDFTGKRLEYAVYDYTLAVLRIFREKGVFPSMIQLGSGVSGGLLWPDGKWPDYEMIALLLNAGICAVRAMEQDIPIVLHLDNGCNNQMYQEWFDNYFANDGEEFDIIGMSYFPYRHGSLADLQYNLNDLAKRYGKDMIVTGVAMPFTMEDYAEYEKLPLTERKGMAIKPWQASRMDYPATKEGQAKFIGDFMRRLAKVPGGHGRGFFYCEPGWIPFPGSGWATEASLKYLKDPGPCGNEWANQALFDYDGRPLPALDVIREF